MRERRATLTDAVRLPMVALAWPSPALYAAGDAELDLAAAILADWSTWKPRFKLLVPPSEKANVGLAEREAVAA